MNELTFKGTEKQNKWAMDILQKANLIDQQIDNLLRIAGPTALKERVMRSRVIIDHRFDLAKYADALGEFYKLNKEERKEVAREACSVMSAVIKSNI